MIQEQLIIPPFLVDANCLIEPYDPYYNPQFDLSAPFWQHLQDLVSKDQVAIIDKVRNEVYGHNCPEIDTWLDEVKNTMVICEEVDGIVEAYRTVFNQITHPENSYQPTAVRE